MKKIFTAPFAAAAVLTLACSLAGSWLAALPYLKVIGALVLALLLGMVSQLFRPAVDYARPGIGLIANKFLRAGIILLGFKLNLLALAAAGVKTICLAVVIVTLTITGTYWLARRFGVNPHLAILTASGTGICGAAAVMGISTQVTTAREPAGQLRQQEDEVVAVAIVAILGTVFTMVDIALRPLLHLTASQFGVLCGGSLHEIAHAVAAGSAGGATSLDAAIITKLSRVLLLAPAAIIVGLWYQRHHGDQPVDGEKRPLPLPWFMLGFILASVAGTFIHPLAPLVPGLVKLAYLLLGMAMAALGMNVNFNVLFTRGKNALLAAGLASTVLMLAVAGAAKAFF